MRLTSRDQKLVRDIALSHVLSRDQIIALGYFTSVTRANTRLRELRSQGLVSELATPLFGQFLYSAGSRASEIVGERVAPILLGRSSSPRFIQHALSLTNVRLSLLAKGATAWRFEQQCKVTFSHAGKVLELKPDGIALTKSGIILVEVDLGHVAPAKFREKLRSFEAFALSGECQRLWKVDSFSVLTVTTGRLRARRLTKLVPENSPFAFSCKAHDELGIAFAGGWS